MKFINTSFVFFLILSLLSCAEEITDNINQTEVEVDKDANFRKIEIKNSISSETVFEYYKEGELYLSESIDTNGILTSKVLIKLDSEQRPKEAIHTKKLDTTYIMKWTYKDDISKMENYVNNELAITYYFHQNGYKNTTLQYGYTKDNYLLDSVKNNYDKEQRRIKQIDFLQNQYYIFVYDENDEIIRQDLFELNSDNFVSSRTFVYEYDTLNNWTKSITIDNNLDTIKIRNRIIEYQ